MSFVWNKNALSGSMVAKKWRAEKKEGSSTNIVRGTIETQSLCSTVASPVPARERDDISDGLDTREVTEESVEAHAEPAMWRRAPAA